MFNVFAALKMLIARTGESLGSVALAAIRDNFIPRLEKDLKQEKNPATQEKIQEVLNLWRVYSDESTSESRLWEGIASHMANETASKWKLGHDAVEDLEQEVAYRFYGAERFTKVQETTKAKGIFSKVDPMGGPKAFANWWKATMYTTLNAAARDYQRQTPGHGFGFRVDETSETEGVLSPTTDLDDEIMREVKEDLDRYVAQRFSGDLPAILSYKMWMDLAEDKGAENIRFSRDIEPTVTKLLKKKKLPHSHGTITGAWREVVQTIVQYFEKELKKPISIQMKKQLKVAEKLAYAEYRRRLAAWVLGSQ
jgi:hypothetical protein